MGRKTVREAKVTDIEKRKYPAKHYVYVLDVSWSEGTITTIYRRYSDFFEFQCELLERFPEEAGAKDPSARMIPFLPGKKLFSRTQTRAVAEKRKEKLNDYCRTLIRLPSKISDDDFVSNFFEVTPDDLLPNTRKASKKTAAENIQEISDPLVLERFVAMADYQKQKKNECSLEAGQQVEVIDQNENGWWFVNVDDFNEGWVPATYLEPLYGTEESLSHVMDPGEEELHLAITNYSPQNDDEIAFEKGVLLEVFEKGLDGWWKVRYQGKEGYAPAAYLQRYHGAAKEEAATGAQVVASVKDILMSTTSNQSTLPAPISNPKPAIEDKPKFAPTWHSQVQPYIDKEPIYAPTPRRHSIKKKPIRAQLPPVATKPNQFSNKSPTSTSPPPFDTGPEYDTPGPVYASISEPKEQIYVTISDFKAANGGDGLSFSAGILCSVITKNATGWWYVDMDGVEGWVPSSYLENKIDSQPVSPLPISSSSNVPPPLPSRNSVISLKNEPLASSFLSGPATKMTPKIDVPISKQTKVKSSMLTSKSTETLSSADKCLMRRSQSTESLDKDPPVKPVMKRVNSPPFLQVSSGSEWKPTVPVSKSTTVTPKSLSTPKFPKTIEIKKATSTSRTLSPKTARLSKSVISEPVLQKSQAGEQRTPVSKTIGVQSANKKTANKNSTLYPTIGIQSANKQIANRNSTVHPSGTKSSHTLTFPDTSSSRPSFGVKSSPSSVARAKKTPYDPVKRVTPNKKPLTLRKSSEPVVTSHNRKASEENSVIRRQSGVKRGGSEDSVVEPLHVSELQGKFSQRKNQLTNNKSNNISLPQRPKTQPTFAPPKPSGPPKRPEPPKIPGGTRIPPPRPSSSPQVKRNLSYVSIGDFLGVDDSCVSFNEGDNVKVVEKNDDGWWFVEVCGTQGWAPSNFLEEKTSKTKSDDKPSRPSRPKPPQPQRPEVHGGPSIPSRPRPPPVKKPELTNNKTSDSDKSSKPGNDLTPVPKPRPRVKSSVSPCFVRAISSHEVPVYEDNGVALVQGRLYEVKERRDSGWWLVKDGDIEGWAPGSHFETI